MRGLFVTSLFAGMVSSQAFCAIRAVTPVAWTAPEKQWRMARHFEKMGIVTNGGARVVFIGDSITHYWETHGRLQLDKYFSSGDRKMLNLGRSADRTEHVLWRIREGRELDGYDAKCIVLMIGTNNTGHFPIEQEPPMDTILGIREIVKTIRTKQPEAILVLTAIFPRGADMADPCRRRNDVVNKEIAKFADGEHVFWCDLNDQFLTMDGELSPEIFPDLIHPNALGYEIWYSAVKPYVDYALSGGGLPVPANRYAAFVRKGFRRTGENPATYPTARCESDGWCERLLRNRNQIADGDGEIDIVLLGDSITRHWDGVGIASQKELEKTYSVLNIAHSGDRTENLLWRCQNGELDGYRAKCVMLMVGTNNEKERPEEVAEGVRAILGLIRRKQPQATTLLLPIFPRGKPDDRLRAKNGLVNARIRDFADEDHVLWIDFTSKFLDGDGDVQWIMHDRLHPNAEGYSDVWLPSVLPYFKNICGK